MKKYFCEALGTLVLVFVGCGSAAIAGTLYQMTPVVTPFAFGFAIIALAFVIGDISGCHVNPAVSLAMFLDKRISGKDCVFYIIAQFIGALLGTALLFVIINDSSLVAQYGIDKFGLAVNGFDDASTFGCDMNGAIITEVVLTFIFVFAVLGSTANKKTSKYAGIIIGLTLALVHIVGIPVTGTSVNPARSFGPALMTYLCFGDMTPLTQLWVFIVAPVVGSVLAYLVYKVINNNNDNPAPKPIEAPKPAAVSAPVAQKPSAPKPVAEKPADKATIAKADAKPAAKPAAKTTGKKPATKTTATKPAAKTTATKTTAKKPAAKTTAKKPAAKPAAKKPASKAETK